MQKNVDSLFKHEVSMTHVKLMYVTYSLCVKMYVLLINQYTLMLFVWHIK